MSDVRAEAVEVIAIFGGTVVATAYLTEPGELRIGTAPGVDVAVAEAPCASFPLVVRRADGGIVVHRHAAIAGRVIFEGRTVGLERLGVASPTIAGAHEVVLVPDARICVEVGRVTLWVTRVPRPQRCVPRAPTDRRVRAYVAASLLAHLAVWWIAMATEPPARDRVTAVASRPRFVRLAPPREPPAVAPTSRETPGVASTVVTTAPPGTSRREIRRERRKTDGPVDLATGATAVMGSLDLKAAMDAIDGPVFRADEWEAAQFGGSRSQDVLANRADWRIQEIGPYGTAAARDKSAAAAVTLALCTGSTACVARGGTARDLVNQHVERRRAALAACYGQTTQAGEVIVAFEIDVDGKVEDARGRGLGPVAGCIANVVASITFPQAAHRTQVTVAMVFGRS